MRMILMGPPGSGKATLAKKLSKALNIPRIHLQDRLASIAGEETELGRLVGELITACAPIPEEVISTALHEEIEIAKDGFVLDDFPRTSTQASQLDQFLNEAGAPLELIVEVHADNDDLMERLVGQLECGECGTKYNVYSHPPMVEGVCDMCGERIARRPPDYEETVANRLRNCEVSIAEMLSYFKPKNITRKLSGLADRDDAYARTMEIISTTERIPVIDPALVEEVAPAKKKRGRPAAEKKKDATPEKKSRGAKKGTGKSAKQSAAKSPAKKSASKSSAKQDSGKAVKKAAKKTATKKTPAKKAAKKAPVKSVSKKKVAKKKVAAKKAPVKKAAKKKVVAKKTPAKKVAKKKVVAKKTPVKKVTKKKALAKKAPVKKVTKKKVAAKKAPVKKVASKKAAVKKKTAKKSAQKKR